MKSFQNAVIRLTVLMSLSIGSALPALAAGDGERGLAISSYRQEVRSRGVLTQVSGTLSCVAPESGPSCRLGIKETSSGRFLQITDGMDEARALMNEGKSAVMAEGYLKGSSFEVTSFN